MDSILISIQPYWVFLIIATKMGWYIPQSKTVEVRKTAPAKDWNRKSIIYCSKDQKSFNRIPKRYQPVMKNFMGKCIGEFFCDYVEKIYCDGVDIDDDTLLETSLERDEINTYANGKILYGLHISELKIYDKPKELSDFIVPSRSGCVNEGKCRSCIYFDKGNGFNIEDDCKAPFCTDEYKPLRRPPQSWCYVRELKGESNGN